MSTQVSLAEQAAFLRAAIMLGLLPSGSAIGWADSVVERSAEPPSAIYDLALTPPTNWARVRDALGAIADAPLGQAESDSVVRAILDLLRADVLACRRGLGEVVALVYRMSCTLAVPGSVRWEMLALEEDYAIVSEGIAGDWPTITAIARDWLT